ncbi:MAG: ABC transporter substrate-binding protein, partial [SAR202 cluster bacterium]|nr:ABC transporter substrate-binding protein [SAR202 cluster bacterium]
MPHMIRRISLFIMPLLVMALVGTACSGDASSPSSQTSPSVAANPTVTPPPRKVVFMAGFKPQANLPFVAAYIAREKGYFAEQGLDVEIRHASTGEHLKLLLAGDIHITTADAGSVLRRRSDPAVPIVAFVLFGQRGQNAYVALASSGMNTPRDWEGKTFGYKTSVPPEYLAILEAEGVDRSKIREVSVGFDPRVLTEGQVDLLAIFKSNEP